MSSPSSRIATRRTSRTRHVVIGVPRWYSGMLGTTECGIRNVDVHEEQAKRGDDLLCRRCTRVLGWDRS